jgi:hypothetical protein
LPTKNFKAEVWDKQLLDFKSIEGDVLETSFFDKNYTL